MEAFVLPGRLFHKAEKLALNMSRVTTGALVGRPRLSWILLLHEQDLQLH